MYKKCLLLMASFKDLKDKIQNKPQENIDDPNDEFNLEESRYILHMIANSENIKGRDIQIVYDIAIKLQSKIKKLTE